MANFIDLLANVFDALGGTRGSNHWQEKDKRDNAMIESRIAQIQAVDKLRNWQDERYATRYVSPTVRNLHEYKQAGGNVAEYAQAQLAAINADPTFQAMSPERQRLVYDKFRQTFASELEVAKAAGDNATYQNLTRSLGLPSNNNYVQLMETSGNADAQRSAIALRNPYADPNKLTEQEMNDTAAMGGRLGNIPAAQRLSAEEQYRLQERNRNLQNAISDRQFLEDSRNMQLETLQRSNEWAQEQRDAAMPLADAQREYSLAYIAKLLQDLQAEPAQTFQPAGSVPTSQYPLGSLGEYPPLSNRASAIPQGIGGQNHQGVGGQNPQAWISDFLKASTKDVAVPTNPNDSWSSRINNAVRSSNVLGL